MNITALGFDSPIDESAFGRLLGFVARERRDGALKYLRRADQERALLGEALVRHQIISNYGLKANEIVFSRNKHGKPLLPDERLHFNISHSGKWVACIIDNAQVGIDVEKIKNIDFEIARRFFSPVEYSDLMSRDGKDRLGYFYDLWTSKESFIKAVGKGLTLSLSSFSIRIEAGGISIDPGNHPGVWHLKQYPIEPGYRLAVCALNDDFPSRLKMFSLDDLIEAVESYDRDS